MEGEIGHAGPLGATLRGSGGRRFAPDEDFAVVGGRSEDGAVFGVGLVLSVPRVLGGMSTLDKEREREPEKGREQKGGKR